MPLLIFFRFYFPSLSLCLSFLFVFFCLFFFFFFWGGGGGGGGGAIASDPVRSFLFPLLNLDWLSFALLILPNVFCICITVSFLHTFKGFVRLSVFAWA